MPSTNPLLEILRKKLISPPPFPWAVAYSGGRDSGVLLWALSQLAPGHIVALHVDHGWRPEAERLAEAELVEAWCKKLGADLRSFPPPTVGLRTEAAARDYRFRCFQAFSDEHPASPIFLAHHADDQAETVLMRLLRGRSWRGLSAMRERRGVFWRPLLGVRAAEIARTAEREHIPWHTDSTNGSAQWTRNHLRLKVFPLLTERFPRAVEALSSFAEAWAELAPEGDLDPRWKLDGEASLDVGVWRSWGAVKRQIQLEAAVAALGFEPPPSRRLLEVAARSSTVSGGGWSWSRTAQRVFWRRVVQSPAAEYFVLAEAEKDYWLPTYRLRWSAQPAEGALNLPVDPSKPVIWRSAAAGMTFSSRGSASWGKQKRRKRLGSLDSSHCALVIQDGLICAVVDVSKRTVLWSEGLEKLNKTGIFVTLEPRSEYERR